MIDEQLTRKKSRPFDDGDVENYVCKFSRGYVGFPLNYKVTFMATSTEVSVERNIDDETHDHQRDDEGEN